MKKDEVLARFKDDLRKSSDHTRRSRLHYAELFLDFAGDPPWSRTAVTKFLDQAAEEYAPGTQRLLYSIVRRVFDAARAVAEEDRQRMLAAADPDDPASVRKILQVLATPLPAWPMGKRDAPRVGDEDIRAPALEFDEGKAMVELAVSGQLTEAESAFLAVASTYGARPEELLRISPEHLDWDQERIFIDTCKGGVKRWHSIPEQIAPHLGNYGFAKEYSPFRLHQMYLGIEKRAGVKHRERAGFHSFRRTLDTWLMDRLGEAKTKVFLRWKLKSSPEMPLRYYTAEQATIDAEVFEVLPFLPFW